jgi:hypothetical protein
MLSTRRKGSHNVVAIAWDDEPDWHLTVVGAVRRIERAASAIEPNLAPHGSLQIALQCSGLTKRINRFRVRAERKRSLVQTAGSTTTVLTRAGVDSSVNSSFTFIQKARIAPNISRAIPATKVSCQLPVLSMM